MFWKLEKSGGNVEYGVVRTFHLSLAGVCSLSEEEGGQSLLGCMGSGAVVLLQTVLTRKRGQMGKEKYSSQPFT